MEVKQSNNQHCGNYMIFQNVLKNMRSVDDHIVGSLNHSLPTSSFSHQSSPQDTCKELFNQLLQAHSEREQAIKDCILSTAESLRDLKTRRDGNREDISLDKCFKSEQRKLRMLQSEINIEDIIKERTLKAFNERCGIFLK